MTAYERREIVGGAIQGRLNANISSGDTSLVLAASPGTTGWPAGLVGPFLVSIDRGEAADGHTEEKVIATALSGSTLTGLTRGVDGTSAAAHTAGVTVEHIGGARDLDEANAHIADDALDHHSQYLNTARHDVEARHQFGAALGAPSAAADIGTAAATGSGDDAAREDHVHKIGAGAINSAGMFAAGVVDAAAIGTDAVGTAEIAADAVTASELADNAVDTNAIADSAVTSAKIANGTIAAADLASDSVTTVKILDANVTAPKIAGGAWTALAYNTTGITWSDLGGVHGVGEYRKETADLVRVRGVVKCSAAASTVAKRVIATLPAGFRPATQKMFTCWSDGGADPSTVVRIDVATNGEISLQEAAATTGVAQTWAYISLDGITFATS